MNDLHDILELVTDRVDSPALAARALASARRRRARHRGVIATAAVAVVSSVVLIGVLNRNDSDGTPPVTTPTTPTQTTRTDITQSPWNPRDVDELAAAAPGVAPALPDIVDPPATATPIADDPVHAAVLAMRTDDAILLLGTDGAWRSLPPPSEGSYGARLSADGTKVAIDSRTGVDAWNLATGERTSVPFPSADSKWLDDWAWIDDSTLLFDRPGAGGWTVDLASGDATSVPYPCCSGYWTVDHAGSVVETTSLGDHPEVVDWGRSDQPAKPHGIGSLDLLAADADTIVGDSDQAIVVLDRESLEPRHVLPLIDPQGNYAGKMGPVAILDEGTVLLQVGIFRGDFSWRIVAWDPQSGELTRVSRGGESVPASYASGLLG